MCSEHCAGFSRLTLIDMQTRILADDSAARQSFTLRLGAACAMSLSKARSW